MKAHCGGKIELYNNSIYQFLALIDSRVQLFTNLSSVSKMHENNFLVSQSKR